VAGLLVAARRHGLTARALDLRSSGDTAGPRDEVVGYGAFAFATSC
jgi:AmmeMemoRadiSam system protein B